MNQRYDRSILNPISAPVPKYTCSWGVGVEVGGREAGSIEPRRPATHASASPERANGTPTPRHPRVLESQQPHLSGPRCDAKVRLQAVVPELDELVEEDAEQAPKLVEERKKDPRGNPRDVLDPHPQRVLPICGPRFKSGGAGEKVGVFDSGLGRVEVCVAQFARRYH